MAINWKDNTIYDLTDAKPINFKGLEHYYAKSNGEVFTFDGHKVSYRNRKNYYTSIQLREKQMDGSEIRKRYSMHRLIALTFVPNPNNHPFVNHIDGNRFNNDASNLEWVTPTDNNMHSVYVLGNSIGEKGGGSKLKESQIYEIMELSKLGLSSPKIAVKYGVCPQLIRVILEGKRWKHITNKEYFALQRAKYLHISK